MPQLYTDADLRQELEAMCEQENQEIVAARLGITPGYLSMLRRGKRAFSDKVLAKLGYRAVKRYEPIPVK